MLIRYWFSSDAGLGFGVTAHSIQDAIELLSSVGYIPGSDFNPSRVVENVSISALDQNHVVPNIGPVVVRGVWFPCRNI
jgi:hypothetical protein